MSTMTLPNRDVNESHSFAPMFEPLESKLLLDSVPFTGSITYTDALGSEVTVKVNGKANGVLSFDDTIVTDVTGIVQMTDGNPIMNIVTDNANPRITIFDATSKTTVTITVKNADKSITTTTIHGLEIFGDGLKSVNAPKVNLSGYDVLVMEEIGGMGLFTMVVDHVEPADVQIVNAAGANITLGDIFHTTMTLGGTSDKVVTSLKANVITGIKFDAGLLPVSITAASIRADFDGPGGPGGIFKEWNRFEAAWFTKITVAESFHGALHANSADAKGVSVGTMTVGREFYGSLVGKITAPLTYGFMGRIGTLTAGTFDKLVIKADSIGTLTAKGMKEGKFTIPGDLKDVLLELRGENVAKGNTLNTVKATSDLLGGEFYIRNGSIGTITVGGDMGNYIQVDNGSIGSISVKGNLYNVIETAGLGHSIGKVTVGKVFSVSLEMGYGEVDGVGWMHTGSIRSMTVGMFNGTVFAGSIGSLTVKGYTDAAGVKMVGDMSGYLQLTGYGVTKGNTLNTLKVSGSTEVGIDAWEGNVGTITIGQVFTGQIEMGNQWTGVKWIHTGSIKSMTVGVFAGYVDAASMGSVTVKGYKDAAGVKIAGDMWSGTGHGGYSGSRTDSNIYLTGDGVTKRGNLLNSVKISGTFSGGIKVRNGDVGTISMGEMTIGDILIDGKVKTITIKTAIRFFDGVGELNRNYKDHGGGDFYDFQGRVQVNGGGKILNGKQPVTLVPTAPNFFILGLPPIGPI